MSGTARQKAVAAAALGLVLLAILWESALAIRAPYMVATDADWRAAAATVRAGFAPGDLIVIAPPWADPLGRHELGDLMPPAMVGRPDAARYGRIWEVSIRGEHAPEARSLAADLQQQHGHVHVARYVQHPVVVTYDAVERFPSARVFQLPPVATTTGERPCLWAGPLPSAHHPTAKGPSGGFACGGSRVERRTMEIDYRPRYGIVVPAEGGWRTVVSFADIPAAAFSGATLSLWFGLHDYYARKTESGPVDVTVDFDPGDNKQHVRASMKVQPDRGWQPLALPLPQAESCNGELRVEVSARDARARNLGFAAEVRR